MRAIGGLHEWLAFLDATNGDEACALLARQEVRLDAVCDELCSAIVPLWDAPGGEVAESLMIARTALMEASGMLRSVRGRFDLGERESA